MNTTGYFFKSFNFDAAGQPIAYRYLPIRKKGEKKKDVYTDYPISVIFQKNGFIFYNQELTPSGYKPQRILSFLNFDDFSDNIPVLQDYHEEKMNFTSVYEKHDLYKNTEVLTYKNTFPSIPNEKTENTLIHQVFLDFLFDFFHSNVFSTSSYYENIKSRLQTHELTKALIAKADYYYHRNLKDDQLETVTKTWLSLIRNKDYEKIIHPDNKWFEPIESEHFNVFYQGEEPKEKTLKDKLWYAFPKPIQILFGKNKRTLSDEAEKSVQWLLERYHLWGAFVLQFGYIRSKLHFWGIVAFTIAVACLLYNNHNSPISFFHGVVGISENILTKDWEVKSIFFLVFVFISSLLAVSLVEVIYGILAFIRSCFNYSKLEEKHYKKFLPSRSFSEWLLSIPKLVEFFKPKILISSAVVWTVLFTNERFWNLDFKIGSLEIIIIIILLVGTFSFMVSIFKPLLPIKTRWKQTWKITRRATLIVILGGIYSFIIGVSTMSFMAKNVLTRNDYLQNYFLGYYENIETREIAKEYENRLPPEIVKKMNLILLPENQEMGDKLTYKNIKKLIEPVNKDKKLFEDVLPYLKQKNALKSNVMIEGYINLNFGRQELAYERNLYIFPDMLFFYTFITLLIGIFAEMGFGKRE